MKSFSEKEVQGDHARYLKHKAGRTPGARPAGHLLRAIYLRGVNLEEVNRAHGLPSVWYPHPRD